MLGSVGCGERAPAVASRAAAGALESPACRDSLRPATAAPAEGLWVLEQTSIGRIAAMIGPSQIHPGEARVVRHVETIETRPDGKTVHLMMDTAVVHLELLPALPDSRGRATKSDSLSRTQAAAVYAVSPRIVLASYEPCATGSVSPRLRYLRRDAAGRPVIDVMLQRTSGGS